MTVEDLNDYRAELIEHPLNISLGDLVLYVPNAPLSGPVLVLILNILKGEWSHHGPAEKAVTLPLLPHTLSSCIWGLALPSLCLFITESGRSPVMHCYSCRAQCGVPGAIHGGEAGGGVVEGRERWDF
jgi:hypothetical protein